MPCTHAAPTHHPTASRSQAALASRCSCRLVRLRFLMSRSLRVSSWWLGKWLMRCHSCRCSLSSSLWIQLRRGVCVVHVASSARWRGGRLCSMLAGPAVARTACTPACAHHARQQHASPPVRPVEVPVCGVLGLHPAGARLEDIVYGVFEAGAPYNWAPALVCRTRRTWVAGADKVVWTQCQHMLPAAAAHGGRPLVLAAALLPVAPGAIAARHPSSQTARAVHLLEGSVSKTRGESRPAYDL
jgi:hypothetical protein